MQPDPELVIFAGRSIDWRYAARVGAPVSAEAQTWARASFQRATLPMRAFLVVGWAALLLKGRPRSDTRHILGWPIAHTAARTAVLERQSRLGIHATLVFTTQLDAVTFSSGMAYTNRVGRVVWIVVAPIHRWAVRAVLTHAASEIGRIDEPKEIAS